MRFIDEIYTDRQGEEHGFQEKEEEQRKALQARCLAVSNIFAGIVIGMLAAVAIITIFRH